MSLNVDTDAILMTDSENTFNSIDRMVMLHNFKFICPVIATFIINCYATPSRLFIVSLGEMTRGDNWKWLNNYGSICISILPLIKFLLEFINLNGMNAKEVVFADDFSVAKNLNSIKDYWEKSMATVPKYVYFTKPKKSYLTVTVK